MKIHPLVDNNSLFVETSYQARMLNNKTAKIFYEEVGVLQYTKIPSLGINTVDYKIVHIPTGNALWENTKSLEEAKDFVLTLDFYVGEELLYKIFDTLDGQVAERGRKLRFLVSELFTAIQQANVLMIQVFVTKVENFYK